MSQLNIQNRQVAELIPYARNSRTHSDAQIAQIAGSIEEFGMAGAIVVRQGVIAKGHGTLAAIQRLFAAGKPLYPAPGKSAGVEPFPAGQAPVLDASGWTEAQFRAYVIADNRLAELAGWDTELLALELGELKTNGFDLDLTGFDANSIDDLMDLNVDGGDARIEPDETVKVLIDKAWNGITREWATHIEQAQAGGLLSPQITPSIAAWHFVQAKHLGGEYPGYLSLAFCPQRFWTAGDRKSSVPDCIAKAHEHEPSMRGVRWATDERPDFDRVLSFGMPMAGARMPLDFPARLARSLIDEFTPADGRVLDPCHGWGGRYVGFLLSDKARAYVGCDPSPAAHAGLERTRTTLSPFAEADKSAEFIEQPIEDVTLTGMFDFALTSPPYFDVEAYSGEHTSSARYPKFEAWVQGFYLPMMRKVAAHLKTGAVFALQVGSQSYPLAQTAIDNAVACGFALIEKRSAGMNNSIQQTPDETAEAVLILRKV